MSILRFFILLQMVYILSLIRAQDLTTGQNVIELYGGQYIGCYGDGCFMINANISFKQGNALSSPDDCIRECGEECYPFAGLRNLMCACSLSRPSKDCSIESTHCGVPCPGNPLNFCGGINATQAYEVNSQSTNTCISTTASDQKTNAFSNILKNEFFLFGIVVLCILFAFIAIVVAVVKRKQGSARISTAGAVSLGEVRQNGCGCSPPRSRAPPMTANTYDQEESVVIADRPRLPLKGNKSMTMTSMDSHQYQMVEDDGDACGGKSWTDRESSLSSTDYNYVYSDSKVYWDKFRKKKAVIRRLEEEERYSAPYYNNRRRETANEKEEDSMITNMLYTMPGKEDIR